jgi:hypothetical protein
MMAPARKEWARVEEGWGPAVVEMLRRPMKQKKLKISKRQA